MDGGEHNAPARSPWMRRLKFAGGLLAISIGLLALVIFVENWRGKQDWAAYQEKLIENNQSINGLGFPPQTIPDDENFAMTPLLAPLADQIVDPVSLRVKLRDNTAVAHALEQFPNYMQLDYPSDAPHDYWGKKTNTKLLYEYVLEHEHKDEITNITEEGAALKILEWVKKYPALDEIEAASNRPLASFKKPTDDLFRPVAPYGEILDAAAKTAFYRGSARMALGDGASAFRDLKLIIFLARVLAADLHPKSFDTSSIVFGYAYTLLWDGLALGCWNAEELDAIRAELDMVRWAHSLNGVLRYELATINRFFEWAVSHDRMQVGNVLYRDTKRKLLFQFTPEGWMRSRQKISNEIYEEHFFICVDQENIFINKPLDCDSIRLKCRSIYKRHWLFPALRPTPFWIDCSDFKLRLNGAAIAETKLKFALIGCSLEKYRISQGEYPQKLHDLVPEYLGRIPLDLLDGKPLRYRLIQENRYRIWSVGWDRIDDGGVSGKWYKSKDWSWEKPI